MYKLMLVYSLLFFDNCLGVYICTRLNESCEGLTLSHLALSSTSGSWQRHPVKLGAKVPSVMVCTLLCARRGCVHMYYFSDGKCLAFLDKVDRLEYFGRFQPWRWRKVSVGKKVYYGSLAASDGQNNFTAESAVDNVNNLNSTFRSGEKQPWFILDLGERFNIGRLVYACGSNNYDLSFTVGVYFGNGLNVGDNFSSFKRVRTVRGRPPGMIHYTWYVYLQEPIQYRFVALRREDSTEPNFLEVSELKVYTKIGN